jgi:DNA mismatch repair protein MutL
MSIRRLPSELINRIAAGEVVERPASALKELVENALDAGATQVAIRLSAGGLEAVEVSDDGTGMTPAEMALALERHATSKLAGDSIDRVTSFGFRGEALPSIASVSRFTLESRVRGSDGWRITVDHGASEGQGPAALPQGTRVQVQGLFDKVPARRKFLRSPRAEYAACLDTVKRLAMARSDVGFTLDHDGRRVLSLQPAEPPARVAELLAHELERHGIGIDCERHGIRMTGAADCSRAALRCPASSKAALRPPTIRPRTAAGSRKRTSVLAGWTLMSTSSSGTSRNKAATGWRSRAIRSR